MIGKYCRCLDSPNRSLIRFPSFITVACALLVFLGACDDNGVDPDAELDEPQLVGAFEDLTFEPEASISDEAEELAEDIDLADTFAGEELTFSASAADESVVITSIEDEILTVTPVSNGETNVSVEAANEAGEVNDTFEAIVQIPSPPDSP